MILPHLVAEHVIVMLGQMLVFVARCVVGEGLFLSKAEPAHHLQGFPHKFGRETEPPLVEDFDQVVDGHVPLGL